MYKQHHSIVKYCLHCKFLLVKLNYGPLTKKKEQLKSTEICCQFLIRFSFLKLDSKCELIIRGTPYVNDSLYVKPYTKLFLNCFIF